MFLQTGDVGTSPDQPAPIHFNVLTEKNSLPKNSEIYTSFTNTSAKSILVIQDGIQIEIKSGQGPIILHGKLEIIYEKGMQNRYILIKENAGFFAGNLRISVTGINSKIRFSDQFEWISDIPSRGNCIYRFFNNTNKSLRIYLKWTDSEEDLLEIQSGGKSIVNGPSPMPIGAGYFIQLKEDEEESGPIQFAPTYGPEYYHVFQENSAGKIKIFFSENITNSPISDNTKKDGTANLSIYNGFVGSLKACWSLKWNVDKSVDGNCFYPNRNPDFYYQLKGDNYVDGQLSLEEYTNDSITAKIILSKKYRNGSMVWVGTMYNTDGRELPVEMIKQ